MHLVIEAVGIRFGGGAIVLQDFLRAALEDARITEVTSLTSPAEARGFALPSAAHYRDLPQRLAHGSAAFRMWWACFGFDRLRRRLRADVSVSMTGIGFTSGARHALFIQQALPFYEEARARFSTRQQLRFRTIGVLMRRAAHKADLVAVQSGEMAQRAASDLGVEPSRIAVVSPLVCVPPAAAALSVEARAMAAAPEGRRVLYIGSTAPHKNVGVVVEGMALLRRLLPGAQLFLTCPPGSPGTGQEGVVGLGWVPHDRVGDLIRQASVLVQPSIAETVGLPMLEAMTCGVPVLASDRAFAHSVCGDAAVFFDPLDPSDFASQACRILTDRALAEALRRRGLSLVSTGRDRDPYRELVSRLVELRRADH